MKHTGCEVFRFRLSRPGCDLCVLESLEGKVLMEDRLFSVSADIGHSRLCRPQVIEVDISVRVQHLEAVQLRFIPRLPFYAELDPSGHVLSEINDRISLRSPEDPFCGDPADLPDLTSALGRQNRYVEGDFRNCLPSALIAPVFIPPIDLQARVISLAIIDLGEENRSERAFPLCICAESLTLSVLIYYFQQTGERSLPAIVISHSSEPHIAFVPAGSKLCAKGVHTLAERIRDIVDLIEKMFVVRRPSRGEFIRSPLI